MKVNPIETKVEIDKYYRKMLITKAATRRIKLIRRALEVLAFPFCNTKF